MAERKALRLKNPIRLPAVVNRIELPVHRIAVSIAAEFPRREGSKFPLGSKRRQKFWFKSFQPSERFLTFKVSRNRASVFASFFDNKDMSFS